MASVLLWCGKRVLGLRNVSRARRAAHRSSWANCLPMCKSVTLTSVGGLWEHSPNKTRCPSWNAVLAREGEMREAMVDAPPWRELTEEVQVEDDSGSEPNRRRRRKAFGAVDNKTTSGQFHRCKERTLIRSHTGPLFAMPFTALPTNRNVFLLLTATENIVHFPYDFSVFGAVESLYITWPQPYVT